MLQYATSGMQEAQVREWLWNDTDGSVKDYLCALSYNLRKVIELRYGLADGHHYSAEETAVVLGKPVQWVEEVESGALTLLSELRTGTAKLRKGW